MAEVPENDDEFAAGQFKSLCKPIPIDQQKIVLI